MRNITLALLSPLSFPNLSSEVLLILLEYFPHHKHIHSTMSPSFKPKKPSNLRSVVLSREQLYEAPPARRRFRNLFFSSILKKQGRQAEDYLERQFSQLNKSRVRGSFPVFVVRYGEP